MRASSASADRRHSPTDRHGVHVSSRQMLTTCAGGRGQGPRECQIVTWCAALSVDWQLTSPDRRAVRAPCAFGTPIASANARAACRRRVASAQEEPPCPLPTPRVSPSTARNPGGFGVTCRGRRPSCGSASPAPRSSRRLARTDGRTPCRSGSVGSTSTCTSSRPARRRRLATWSGNRGPSSTSAMATRSSWWRARHIESLTRLSAPRRHLPSQVRRPGHRRHRLDLRQPAGRPLSARPVSRRDVDVRDGGRMDGVELRPRGRLERPRRRR